MSPAKRQGVVRSASTLRLAIVSSAVVAAVLVLLGTAGTAYGRGRTTLVVGYVSAGAPVSGARLTVFTPSGRRLKLPQKRDAQESDADGYFVLVLPGRPSSVRVVATGGSVRGERIDGSLQAIVVRPGVNDVVVIDPVSTVIAAYLHRHPGLSLARATRKGRRLLTLSPADSIGPALLQVTPYFDGLSFLRDARAHGGVQRYVAALIRRGRPVSFRGPYLLGGVQDYLKLLTTAKDTLSGVFSIGKAAYDIFKWAQGPEPTTGDIYNAVQELKTQLNAIQSSLDEIKQKVDDGFKAILDEIKNAEFDRSVKPLEDLARTVYKTQLDFKVLLDNATARYFNPQVAKEKTDAISANMNEIEKAFNQEGDVFRDGILKKRTTPAYYYYGQTLLARTAHFMTPGDSAELQNLASWVLQYQALAFNLIVRYENHEGQESPNAVLTDALKAYLGFDASQARNWLDNQSPVTPSSGDLSEELAYLDTVQPVPAHTIVEADGLQDVQGPMWQASDAAPIELGRNIYARQGGMGCADRYYQPHSEFGKLWCQYMWKGWTTAQNDLTGAENALGASLAGWKAATVSQTQTLFKREGVANVLQIKPDYWDPYDFTFRTSKYNVTENGAYADYYTGYYYYWVDAVDVTTIKGLPQESRGNTGTCFFGVGDHKGTNCPVLHVLLRRTPLSTEHYWPYQK